MSMKHTYDWKFTAPDAATPGSGLTAQTTLLEPESGKIFFDAKLVLKRCAYGLVSLLLSLGANVGGRVLHGAGGAAFWGGVFFVTNIRIKADDRVTIAREMP